MSAREVPRPFKFHWAALRDTPRLRDLLRKLAG
jgi:hypothetical protein